MKTRINEFEMYLMAMGRSHRTIATYRDRLAKLPDVPLSTVTPSMIDCVIAELRQKTIYEKHPTRRPMPKRLSPATINSHIKHMRAFFNWCVGRGYIAINPAGHIKTTRLKKSPVSKAIDPHDLHKLIQAATHPRDHALLLFLRDTGCRAGEVVNLKWADVNLAQYDARVVGKTGLGVVDFSAECAKDLDLWQGKCPSKHYVFVSLDAPYHPLTVAGLYQVLRRLARGANVTGRFNPHSIRHRVATVYAQNVDLETARQKLRHADVSTTAQYVHVPRGRLKELTERLKID